MSVLLIVGGMVQIVALFLDELLVLLFKTRWLRDNEDYNYAYAEWQTGSVLQLQRLAQEGVGTSSWTGATDLVPVPHPGRALAVLDLENRNHPKLTLACQELTHIVTDASVRKRVSIRYERIQDLDHL